MFSKPVKTKEEFFELAEEVVEVANNGDINDFEKMLLSVSKIKNVSEDIKKVIDWGFEFVEMKKEKVSA